MTAELPTYSDEELLALSDAELIQLMIRDEDRVPRNVIAECVKRGDVLVPILLAAVKPYSEDQSLGDWWYPIHCGNILGCMSSELAGKGLFELARVTAGQDAAAKQLSLTAALFPLLINKPFSLTDDIKTVAKDQHTSYEMRKSAISAVVARCEAHSEVELNHTLNWLLDIAQTEGDDLDVRFHAANLLLHFHRPEFRQALEDLVDTVIGWEDIEHGYDELCSERPWLDDEIDPWQFYDPIEIELRQKRWAQKDARSAWRDRSELRNASLFDVPYEPVETYVRETPKLGRNDPCHCGSGKKYKKCCLGLV
jgi:hypothetical protein